MTSALLSVGFSTRRWAGTNRASPPRKEAYGTNGSLMDFGRLHCYYRQPEITGPSLHTWQSILSSLVMSPRKKHAPKDNSADQTKGSTICNLEKRAYLTTSRLSSSTSNRYAQPTAASGRRRKNRR